ncbi:MAG: NAD-dependent malic enzyme [Enterobacterales bacterium]
MKLTKENKKKLYVPYYGQILLEFPLLNKGSAFSLKERINFNLEGLLPDVIETIDEQSERAWRQYKNFHTNIDRHIYLRNIQDTNETLFYKLLTNHLEEMLPIIYTPTVGVACERFSYIYRRARGLFISYNNRNKIKEILQNSNKKNIKIIVITDGERILGLGDQGIGGMGIPIGKLSLYTVCGGIDPSYTLPIVLDVGTNNKQLLQDPLYMGWKHSRISGTKYIDFIGHCIKEINNMWPNVLLHFEDFSQENATPLLHSYKDKLCCFNDDIQGTAAVTLGCLLSASNYIGKKLNEHTIIFLGAGSAGCGIAEQIMYEMCSLGLDENAAKKNILILDRNGLITDKSEKLLNFQKKFAYSSNEIFNWNLKNKNTISLYDVIKNKRPTVLIGVSGQKGLFNEKIIRSMHKYCKIPIIMPLSNPTSCVEATPEDIINWTNGEALIATGSPFKPVKFNGKIYNIPQCNNAYIFPGIGLGIISSGVNRITTSMLSKVSKVLSSCTKSNELLPSINDIQTVSKLIATSICKYSLKSDINQLSSKKFNNKIEKIFWLPEYRNYKRTSFKI